MLSYGLGGDVAIRITRDSVPVFSMPCGTVHSMTTMCYPIPRFARGRLLGIQKTSSFTVLTQLARGVVRIRWARVKLP